MAVFEAYCTEIAVAARLSAANTVEKAEVVIDMAAAGTAVVTMAAAVLSGLP